MGKISDLQSMKRVFQGIKDPVIGVGTSAFSRAGAGRYLPDYHIICMKNGLDIPLISEDFRVMSLESMPEAPGRRNSFNILRSPRTKEYVSRIGKPSIMFYKVTRKAEKFCDRMGWGIIGNRTSVFYDNKIRFRRAMEDVGVSMVPGEISRIGELRHDDIEGTYGKDYVIQIGESSGGKGTFFVHSERDFETTKKNVLEKSGNCEVIVTKFIRGYSPAIAGCVTRHGVILSGIRYQLMDINDVMNPGKGNGVFCGNDWTASREISGKIRKRAAEYGKVIGEYLKSIGYRGIFGVDMISNKDAHIVELNPRLIGCFPVLTMIQETRNEPLLTGFHLLEFLNKDYSIEPEEINGMTQGRKRGSHLSIFNKSEGFAVNRGLLKPGVYGTSGGELEYMRPGYRMSDLEDRKEIILTDGVPGKDTTLRPNNTIMRMMTRERIMDRETHKLNEWSRGIIEKIYKKLDIVTMKKELPRRA